MNIKLSGWGVGLAAAVVVQLAGQGALAATYYWSGGAANITDGTPVQTNYALLSGIWDTTIKNWSTDLLGTHYVAWPNTGSDTAFFVSPQVAGNVSFLETVTQTVDMTVGTLCVSFTNAPSVYSDAYFITSTNSRNITLTGPAPTISVLALARVRQLGGY